jgi:hypothetical protein
MNDLKQFGEWMDQGLENRDLGIVAQLFAEIANSA